MIVLLILAQIMNFCVFVGTLKIMGEENTFIHKFAGMIFLIGIAVNMFCVAEQFNLL